MLATPRATPVRARSLALGLPLLLTALLAFGVAPAEAAPAPATPLTALDVRDRASVAAAYHDVYRPAVAVKAPTPALSTTTTCTPGSAPADLQNATRDLVNYFRAMSGVGPVTFDATFSAKAQKAALIGHANGTLSANPSPRSACYSADGAEAAGSSNLALHHTGAEVVRAYMDEAGADNTSAGHRWWLQKPSTVTMGNGTVGGSNALWVVGDVDRSIRGPRYTSWPSAGYLPGPLEPGGRWSFTTWDPDYDLSRATVAVRGPGGDVPVRQGSVDPAFGSLVFDLGPLDPPRGPVASAYEVTVTNILKRGEPITPYRYRVDLFDPEADLPLEAAVPAVSGTPEVGQTLSAAAPSWSLPGTSTTYQWFRGDAPVGGATGPTYLLAPADAGQRISVAATGTVAGRDPVVLRSLPTPAVTAPAAVNLTATSPDQGQVALAFTVTSASDPTPDGRAEIHEGGTVVARDVPVVDGRAEHTLTGVGPGSRTYTVRYLGGGAVSPGTSPAAAVTVLGPTAAQLQVLSSTSTAPGQLTIEVAVSATGESSPGGRIEVRRGTTVVGSPATVTDGRATWTASGLPVGDSSYEVRFLGSARVAPGSVTTVAKVRDRAMPTLKATATSPSVGVLKLGVAVLADGETAPGGTVTITEGTRTVASKVAVVDGEAVWTGKGLSSGKHTYTVRYSGTSRVKPTAATVATTVKAKGAPSLMLKASSPSSRKVSVAVTVKATGQSALAGTVTVKEGSKTLTSGLAVKAGKVTWTATKVTAGKHTYTVVYNGTSEVTTGSAKVAVTAKK